MTAVHALTYVHLKEGSAKAQELTEHLYRQDEDKARIRQPIKRKGRGFAQHRRLRDRAADANESDQIAS